MTLEEELAAKRQSSYELRTPEQRQVQRETVAMVEQSDLTQSALKVGDVAPDFTLPNAVGETVSLAELLTSGPVIISFYRGGWCPYCNLELRALQARLGDVRAAGGELVAISPEHPDSSLDTAEKNALEFPVLSDVGNEVARTFRLVHQINPEWVSYQLSIGIDVAARNASDVAEVPLPATYVVGQDGIITYALVDADYTKRAEPDDVLRALSARAGMRPAGA
jgi:peroxiredoxin